MSSSRDHMVSVHINDIIIVLMFNRIYKAFSNNGVYSTSVSFTSFLGRCSSERPQAKKSQENLQRRSKFHEASSLKTN